jgi:serine/threonine-protein kinase
MALTSGSRIGPFEIVSQLGAGGMGEVHQARDTVLDRDVAIKALPEPFANDPERLMRFEREAKALASLNHPNIAGIYGLEQAGSARYLILELVPGETLAERLARGPLSVPEALEVCRQIAEALEAAHDRGILHRDLKPQNVKLTADGRAKVLDFGLAKSFGLEAASGDPARSPTVTTGGTREGVIFGTAAYMSPEQARGKPLDRRSDVWSFGCVLFECLTGRRAFYGETISDTIAAVIGREPDWSLLPPETPAGVRTLLRRCLRKEIGRRFRDLGDARIELEEAALGETEPMASGGGGRRVWPWVLCGALALALAASLLWSRGPAPAAAERRVALALPPGRSLSLRWHPALALSPDGKHLVYAAEEQGVQRLYLRALDRFEATGIAGTEGGRSPFFSPDGAWLAFFAEGKLKKVSLSGGAPQSLAAAPDSRGGCWLTDDTIVVAPLNQGGLAAISARGGPSRTVAEPVATKGEISLRWPSALPDGRGILATAWSSAGLLETRTIALSLEHAPRRDLIEGGTGARYLAGAGLIYAQAGGLHRVPFDPDRLEIAGAPVKLLDGVVTESTTGAAQFTVAADGTLVFVPGDAGLLERHLVAVARDGAAERLSPDPGGFSEPRLAPDGVRLALTVEGDNDDVWIFDLERRTMRRLTFEPNMEYTPIWSPDGGKLVYSAERGGSFELIMMPADGGAAAQRLRASPYWEWATSWSPNGRELLLTESHPTTRGDIWTLELDSRRAQPWLRTPADEDEAVFSPDGRHVAYISDSSGRYEVYVQAYPGPGGRWQISTEGGRDPAWSLPGDELLYREGDRFMSVGCQLRPDFVPERPRELLRGDYLEGHWDYLRNYDVLTDGRLVLIEEAGRGPATQLQVVLHGFAARP